MHRIIRIKAYEAEHGPHFNDEHARKAVSKMENEDGTRGQHWSLEETTALANQYGIRLDEKINKYDWYVALNMVYSDYYRVVVSMTGSNNTKYFVELAKAWMHDKDIITTQGYESQLAIVNQTNTLTSNANTQFNILGAKIDAQTQIINDKFCQLEMREMQNKIDSLRQENNQLALAASQQAQTANIVNQLRPTPVPAYLTCNPYGCNGGFTGYGYNGYSDGCGCGC